MGSRCVSTPTVVQSRWHGPFCLAAPPCVCVRACVCARVRVCARARACVCVCVCLCVCVFLPRDITTRSPPHMCTSIASLLYPSITHCVLITSVPRFNILPRPLGSRDRPSHHQVVAEQRDSVSAKSDTTTKSSPSTMRKSSQGSVKVSARMSSGLAKRGSSSETSSGGVDPDEFAEAMTTTEPVYVNLAPPPPHTHTQTHTQTHPSTHQHHHHSSSSSFPSTCSDQPEQ
jgi:hypothetical protein